MRRRPERDGAAQKGRQTVTNAARVTRPRVERTFRSWMETITDGGDRSQEEANTFYSCLHFHLNPMVPFGISASVFIHVAWRTTTTDDALANTDSTQHVRSNTAKTPDCGVEMAPNFVWDGDSERSKKPNKTKSRPSSSTC